MVNDLGNSSCLKLALIVEVKVPMWMFAGLFSALVITSAAAQSCPANQIASDAQIVLHEETVVPASARRLLSSDFDTNLTFFSEVLGYNDDEIQQEVQNALQFFSERFGLDFSLSQANELGLRFFQNATLAPVFRRVDSVAILNRWVLSGNTRSKCFRTYAGGFLVTFSGEQILKGTYGGEKGINLPNNRALAYTYRFISVPPPCESIVIRFQSPVPTETRRSGQTGITVIFREASHRALGQGAAQGLVQAERFTAANGTSFFRFSTIIVLTFPPNALTSN